jgi:hypothetical protein
VCVFTNREPAAELLAEELDLHCALAFVQHPHLATQTLKHWSLDDAWKL